jgi:hypothetical protein
MASNPDPDIMGVAFQPFRVHWPDGRAHVSTITFEDVTERLWSSTVHADDWTGTGTPRFSRDPQQRCAPMAWLLCDRRGGAVIPKRPAAGGGFRPRASTSSPPSSPSGGRRGNERPASTAYWPPDLFALPARSYCRHRQRRYGSAHELIEVRNGERGVAVTGGIEESFFDQP